MMKSKLPLAIAILVYLLVAAGSYVWVNALLDSVYAYRSPLRAAPPAPGQPLGKPAARQVLFVLIDALRDDTSHNAEVMPFLNDLRARGAWATMHSRPPSYSEPGYTVLLTGAWPDISDGPAVNLAYDLIPTWTQDNLFSAAHRAGFKTAVSGYNWFEKLIPQADVNASFYTPGEDQAADRAVVDAALPWLRSGEYQLVLVHIDQVDYAGHHEGGPRDPRWNAAAARADGLLRELVGALDLSRDAVLVVSDHGQIDAGGHGGTEPIVLVEPFVLAGAGVRPGAYGDVNMVDVAPTLATLLGTALPASSQGQPRTALLALEPETLAALEPALRAQQDGLLKAYQIAIDSLSDVPPGDDTVATHQEALLLAHDARLAVERWPRAFLALILALLPLLVVVVGRVRNAAWWLAGAALYGLLFNLRYAVLDGRTYSLSSVTGATDLIIYCAVTAAIALAVAWAAALFGSGAFRSGRSAAVQATLGMTFTTLYVLVLFVLWSFALNGVLVTWTLPDFPSMFLAFISLIQMLIVAVLALPLLGIAAVVTK
jgi:hypothetical protein